MNVINDLLMKIGVENIVWVVPAEAAEGSVRFDDARSAAFYAMGTAVKTGKNCALIVPGEYITNTLTAVTEAWFQKANLLLIGVFTDLRDLRTAWIDRCLNGQVTLRDTEIDEHMEEIEAILALKGPKMISVLTDPVKSRGADYSEMIRCLRSCGAENVAISCYNADLSAEETAGITNIPARYKFGTISKYIGGSAVLDRGILLCTPECILVDINIFRTKYLNANMKIAILDEEEIIRAKGIDEWFASNGWTVINAAPEEESAYRSFLESDKASVLIAGRRP